MSEKTAEDSKWKIARGRGKETLFRVSARNQIELIAIADNKANMITGLNVILISLIIAALGSGFTIKGEAFVDQVQVIVPFAILMTFNFLSAILAIIAAKPVIIKPPESNKFSLLFFQNFYRKSLESYLEEMRSLLTSREQIYDQLIIDMYNNGLVLKQKYFQIGVSYLLFLIGLILSVGSFVILMFAY